MLNRGSNPVVRCAGGSSSANPRPAGAPAISIGMEGEYARRLRRDVLSFFLRRVRYEACDACAGFAAAITMLVTNAKMQEITSRVIRRLSDCAVPRASPLQALRLCFAPRGLAVGSAG